MKPRRHRKFLVGDGLHDCVQAEGRHEIFSDLDIPTCPNCKHYLDESMRVWTIIQHGFFSDMYTDLFDCGVCGTWCYSEFEVSYEISITKKD